MSIKKETIKDGIFQKERLSAASIKDTPQKELEAGLVQTLIEAGRRNTSEYIFETLELQAQTILEKPKSMVRNRKIREAEDRRRRDAKEILQQVDFLRTLTNRKETNPDFLLLKFFYLGALAQRALIRPLEPDVFRGQKILASSSDGGNAKAGKTHESLEDRNLQWQADAKEIWNKRPSCSRWRVAGMLEEKYHNTPILKAKRDTIYRIIKK